MNDNKLECIVQNFITIMPLFQKKLFRQECCLESENLTSSHFQILLTLHENGSSSISEIAKKLLISNPNMTSLIDRLISKKMVERVQDSKDRRIIKILITEEGEKYLNSQLKFISNTLITRLSLLSDEVINTLFVSMENLKEVLLMIGADD
jgi:DNA-binding MarR family transcriptional regulator